MRHRSTLWALAPAALFVAASPADAHTFGVTFGSHGGVSNANVGSITHVPSGHGPAPQLGGNGGGGRGGPAIKRRR
jgi:hypothetical protein